MNRITGIYYDGKSSKPIPVTVELGVVELKLTNESGALGVSELTWEVNRLEDVDFSSSNIIQLKYGKFPAQSLVIDDVEDIGTFKNFYPDFHSGNLYKRLLKGNALKVFGISLLVLVTSVVLYLWVIAPFVAEKAVQLVSKNVEITLGEKMTESLFATLEVDEEKSELLLSFFESTNFQSDYPIKLYYVDEPTVNAFAVPGGKIVVYRGILDKMESWQELAGLLGHELAHVEERHSLEAMSRSLSSYLVFSILTGDVNGVGAVLVENSMMLRDLSHSRMAENEADRKGFEYMIQQEISPQGMIDLFEHLQEAEPELGEKGNQLLKIMSTHPLTEDRIVALKSYIAAETNLDFTDSPESAQLFKQLQGKYVNTEEAIEQKASSIEDE